MVAAHSSTQRAKVYWPRAGSTHSPQAFDICMLATHRSASLRRAKVLDWPDDFANFEEATVGGAGQGLVIGSSAPKRVKDRIVGPALTPAVLLSLIANATTSGGSRRVTLRCWMPSRSASSAVVDPGLVSTPAPIESERACS